MAGIGFELKNLFADTKGVTKANIAVKSVVVSTGPWLISIATLASLLIFLKPGMNGTDFYTLSGTFVYTFIFSMIISSPISNAATRHLSDKLYEEDFAAVSSVFLSSFASLDFIDKFVFFFVFFRICFSHIFSNRLKRDDNVTKLTTTTSLFLVLTSLS